MDFFDSDLIVIAQVILHKSSIIADRLTGFYESPGHSAVRNVTSGMSRRCGSSNATTARCYFINVETIPNFLPNSIQTVRQPLWHVITDVLRTRIGMLSQINIKLTCIVNKCPVNNTIAYNTSIVGWGDCARGA